MILSAEQAKYLESLPLHPSQTAVEITPEYTVFHYRLVPTFDLKQEILSRGSTLEVLEPEWYRNEIIKALLYKPEEWKEIWNWVKDLKQ